MSPIEKKMSLGEPPIATAFPTRMDTRSPFATTTLLTTSPAWAVDVDAIVTVSSVATGPVNAGAAFTCTV